MTLAALMNLGFAAGGAPTQARPLVVQPGKQVAAVDLTYIRSVEALPSTCHLQAREIVPDGRGGYTESWRSVYQDIPCRMTARKGARKVIAGKIGQESHYMLTLAFDQGVEPFMRVVHANNTYEVVFVNDGHSLDGNLRCVLRRVA